MITRSRSRNATVAATTTTNTRSTPRTRASVSTTTTARSGPRTRASVSTTTTARSGPRTRTSVARSGPGTSASVPATANARSGNRTRVSVSATMNVRSRPSTRPEVRIAITGAASTTARPRLPVTDPLYRLDLTRLLIRSERKLRRSCEHVVLLNDKIRGLTKRYKKARAEGFKTFRYNLRIRLAAVEGVRNMFYEYARDKAEDVAGLRKELFDQNVHIVGGYDDDEDTYSDMASSSEEYDDEDFMEDDVDGTN